MKKASKTKDKSKLDKLEKAARKLLGLPKLPDGATGPRSRMLLAQIQKDQNELGNDVALKKWAKYSSLSYAYIMDDDPIEYKNSSKMRAEHLKNKNGDYQFPHSNKLEKALSDSSARSKCNSEDLSLLDEHINNMEVVIDDDTL